MSNKKNICFAWFSPFFPPFLHPASRGLYQRYSPLAPKNGGKIAGIRGKKVENPVETVENPRSHRVFNFSHPTRFPWKGHRLFPPLFRPAPKNGTDIPLRLGLFSEIPGCQQQNRPLDGVPGIAPVSPFAAVVKHLAVMGDILFQFVQLLQAEIV